MNDADIFDDTYWQRIDAEWAKDNSKKELANIQRREQRYQPPQPVIEGAA